MTTIRVVAQTTLPPDHVLFAARDFSVRRAEIFPAVSVPKLEIHSEAKTSAEVTEGTRAGFGDNWERCDYDWSKPGSVTATVKNSNVYAVPGSSLGDQGDCERWRQSGRDGLDSRVSGKCAGTDLRHRIPPAGQPHLQ